MTKPTKFSHQRQIIYDILDNSHDHLTAEEIFKLTQKVKKNISLATVYRNLHLLEEQNQIIKIQIPNHPPKYEAASNMHHHFVCKKCNRIQHINNPETYSCQKCITDKNKFSIDTIISTVIGICSNCQDKPPKA